MHFVLSLPLLHQSRGLDLSRVRTCVVVAEERPRIALTQSFSKLFKDLGLHPRAVSTSFGCRVNLAICLQVQSVPSSSPLVHKPHVLCPSKFSKMCNSYWVQYLWVLSLSVPSGTLRDWMRRTTPARWWCRCSQHLMDPIANVSTIVDNVLFDTC